MEGKKKKARANLGKKCMTQLSRLCAPRQCDYRLSTWSRGKMGWCDLKIWGKSFQLLLCPDRQMSIKWNVYSPIVDRSSQKYVAESCSSNEPCVKERNNGRRGGVKTRQERKLLTYKLSTIIVGVFSIVFLANFFLFWFAEHPWQLSCRMQMDQTLSEYEGKIVCSRKVLQEVCM